MQEVLDKLKSYSSQAIIDAAFRLLAGLAVLIIGFTLIKWLMKLLAKSRLLAKLDQSASAFTRTLISVMLKVLVILTFASVVGVPMASILAIIGSVGLAIGLSLQGSLSNFAGGILIVALKPFKLGDVISPEKGETGTVVDIGIFYTKIKTFDNREVLFPNGSLLNQTIVNVTSYDLRRADIEFTVAFESDIALVKRILTETAEAHPNVLKDPPIFARLIGMSDTGMKFALQVWCRKEDHYETLLDLRENVKTALDKSGVALPCQILSVRNP